MPKFSKKAKSALETTRQLLKQNKHKNQVESDSSESDVESEESGEFSHVPLKVEIPTLTSLSLENNGDMEQIMNQLAQISEQLTQINTRQDEQDRRLSSLQNVQQNEPIAVNQERQARSLIETLSRIPDPIKSLPNYDGNKKQLNSWLSTAEKTLATFKPLVSNDVFTIYEQAVLNKLEGRAKDAICMACDINSFEEAKEILINTLGDKFELSTYKAQLWKNRQGAEMSVHKYYQTTKLIVQNIKTLAKQDPTYATSWVAISKFIDEDALAAFITGLNENYFGFAQAAKPESLEDAYAFLCKFNSREKIIVNHDRKNTKQNKINTIQNQIKHSTKQDKNDIPAKTERAVEPMEVDPSLRSRLTLNKRHINNHEVSESEEDSSTEEQDENELNFHQVQPGKSQT